MSFVLLTPKLDKRLSTNSYWKAESKTITAYSAEAKGAIQVNFMRVGPDLMDSVFGFSARFLLT